MTKNTLPTYAIVELLIRLSPINPLIGGYKGHTIYDYGVLIKTAHGSIIFSKAIIMQQFEDPDKVTEAELADVALLFKPGGR